MDLTALTFGLSLTGYALLTARLVAAVRPTNGRLGMERWLAGHTNLLGRATALVIVPHVYLIWSDRFAWDFERSIRSGWLNWSLFHGSFILIAIMGATPGARGHWRKLVAVCWLAVTPSVAGAPFVYAFLSSLAAPILGLIAIGLLALVAAILRRRQAGRA